MRAHLAAALVVTLAMLTILAHFAVADRAITIRRASPAIAHAPADLRIEVSIAPDPENRLVVVWCDNGAFYNRSDWPVEGLNGPRFFATTWRDVPAGEYDIVAVVRSNTRERGRTTVRVIRVGR